MNTKEGKFWVRQDQAYLTLCYGNVALCTYGKEAVAFKLEPFIDKALQLQAISTFLEHRSTDQPDDIMTPFIPHNVLLAGDTKEAMIITPCGVFSLPYGQLRILDAEYMIEGSLIDTKDSSIKSKKRFQVEE